MDKRNKKVAIGMSGGVDSSVSAMLLKEQGYDVIGVFMKFWHDPKSCQISRENACCDEKALMDARKVADQIGVPLYTLDVRGQFKESVTDYFVDEYKNFRTPNPCVVCNKKIKFGWFIDFAKKIGCEYVATGHYARIKDSSEVSGNDQLTISDTENCKPKTGNYYHLLKGVDSAKDQTYFLYQLDQEQLAHIIFPVGEMTKDQVRELAKKHNLPTSEKKESQEVCFIPDNYRSFLKRNLSEEHFKSGEIVDKNGNVIGKHEGLINYTIGQRRGINQDLGLRIQDSDKKPMYVIGFDKENNRLVVGEENYLMKSETIISDLHLIDPRIEERIEKKELGDLKVKIRYRAKEVRCKIFRIRDSEFKIQFDEPQRAITPGQSAVFYSGEEVIGGGIIE